MVAVAAILAGGRSTRMGKDKALLSVDGVSLTRRTADVLTACGVQQVFAVGRQQELASVGLPVITESHKEHHPLFGVAAALKAIDEPLVLFVPCDLVNLMTTHVQVMLDFGAPCVASNAGVVHPLIAVLPPELGIQAEHIATTGGSAHRLIEGLPIIDLPEPELTDANHPEQLPR